jgi:hypothetical protein
MAVYMRPMTVRYRSRAGQGRAPGREARTTRSAPRHEWSPGATSSCQAATWAAVTPSTRTSGRTFDHSGQASNPSPQPHVRSGPTPRAHRRRTSPPKANPGWVPMTRPAMVEPPRWVPSTYRTLVPTRVGTGGGADAGPGVTFTPGRQGTG